MCMGWPDSNCLLPTFLYTAVHGFLCPTYTVFEGERVATTFQINVKGTTSFPFVPLLGTITADAITTGTYCYIMMLVNPRRACATRYFCPSVCPSVTTLSNSATTRNKAAKVIPMGSVPHWLDFRKSTAFKSYGMKTKRTSQYANEHGLPRPDSARFEHGGGSTRNMKSESVRCGPTRPASKSVRTRCRFW